MPPLVVFDLLITLMPLPMSFDSTLPQCLIGVIWNESPFALQSEHVVAAAPTIDRTRRANVKILIDLVIVFVIIFPP
jgi:hypothetical protein